MRHIISSSILFCLALFTCQIHAQTADDLKRQMNNIKKNTDFIYGQAAGEDEDVTYNIAYEMFLQKVRSYIQTDSVLKDAEAVLLPTIKSKVKKISFERHINSKVVCLYVNKKDLQPLYKENFIPVKAGPASTVTPVKADPAPVVIPEKDGLATHKECADTLVNVIPEGKNVEDSISLHKGIPSNEARQEPTPVEGNMKVTVTPVEERRNLTVIAADAKSSALLTEISNAESFDEIKILLERRKSSSHDIMFKATMNFNVQNAYWAIFDKTKRLVALLDMEKRIDFLTNREIDSRAYSGNPKIWIQIY